MSSLALEGNDLVIEHGRLQITSGTEEIMQSVSTRIRMVRGEFFADLGQGVPYVEQILIRNPETKLPLIRNIFAECIAETPGVKDVKEVDVVYLRPERRLTVAGTFTSYDGITTSFAPVQIDVG